VAKGALTLLVTLAALAATGQAHALSATKVRIGNHPAFVRVVVEFEDGTLRLNRVFASDPRPFADGRARIRIDGPESSRMSSRSTPAACPRAFRRGRAGSS
jgi:hypothetical protein